LNQFFSVSLQGVEFVAGDVLKLDSLYRVMEKVEVVIHLAADMDFFPPNPDAVYAVRFFPIPHQISA
jgi:nucleoside-diphosphate-sugar epimerase